jgi:hypothetical protein
MTPLDMACTHRSPGAYEVAKVFLQWGARTYHGHLRMAKENKYKKLARLLITPLGGRRCELLGLKSRSDLNGLTCIVGRYFGQSDRYEVTMEATKVGMSIQSSNLKRRDRTWSDPGVLITYVGFDSETDEHQYRETIVGEPTIL